MLKIFKTLDDKGLFRETNNTYEIRDGKVSEVETVTVPDEYVLTG